jgi:hypothetical protein
MMQAATLVQDKDDFEIKVIAGSDGRGQGMVSWKS